MVVVLVEDGDQKALAVVSNLLICHSIHLCSIFSSSLVGRVSL